MLNLFLPFIVGAVFLEIPYSNVYSHQTNYAISNLLFVFSIFLVIAYQGYLALGFLSISVVKPKLFQWNTYILLLFIAVYFLYECYSTLNICNIHSSRYNMGPLRRSDIGGLGWIIIVFLIHAFITFYFINYQFVKRKIKLISDSSEREKLTRDFLIPMKTIMKMSIWIFVVFLALSTIADLIKFRSYL